MAKKDLLQQYEQLRSDFAAKKWASIYFLTGTEVFYIDEVSRLIEEGVLSEDEKAFNLTVVYGRETQTSAVVAAAKRYPMMAERQVVIVKEAQDLSDLDGLMPYLQQPTPTTVLVFCFKYKKPDGRSAFAKAIKEKSVYVEFEQMYDNKLPGWIQAYTKGKGYKIGEIATRLLADNIGNDLSGIANALGKLFILVPPGSEITTKLIEDNIGFSKEFSVFELQNALGERDVFKSMRIAQHFANHQKENPFPVTIGSLNTYFTRILYYHYLPDKSKNNVASALGIHPFFVDDLQKAARHYSASKVLNIVAMLREYDMRSKGVGTTGNIGWGELTREMIFKILH